jgi:hypothetical protein
MTTGAALLAALDTALPIDGAPTEPDAAETQQFEAGVAAAVSLNDLLVKHGRSWDDVIGELGSRLGKLCGRLGSTYEAERAAAYDHAVRLLRRRGVQWSSVVRLPQDLAEALVPLSLPTSVLPPEDDWRETVRLLEARAAWRSDRERDLLRALGARLAGGHAIDNVQARHLRDMWWSAELNLHCCREHGPERTPGDVPG